MKLAFHYSSECTFSLLCPYLCFDCYIRQEKIKSDFDKAWKAQKVILKDSQVKLYKDKGTISLQWQSYTNWDDSPLATPERRVRSLNALGRGKFPHTSDAIERAIAIAKEIDLKLKANSFTWQDYPQWLPNELKPKNPTSEKPKTIAEWIEEYERDYWSTRSQDKTTKQYFRDEYNWNKTYLRYLKRIKNWDETPSEKIFNETLKGYPKSVKRNECCSRLKDFARFCGLTDYDPQEFRLKKNQFEVKAKPKIELSEAEIEQWYNRFSDWDGLGRTDSYWECWQWMYGMQATYGFRNHEVLNIYNLDCEYVDSKGTKYYPFTDPIKNPRGIIYTEGKGIKRVVFLAQPMRWIEQFKLREIPVRHLAFMAEIKELSRYEQEKRKTGKLHSYIEFLRKHGFTFTAYNLRHAYNVKSHGLGIPVSLIAQNLGHSIAMNQSVYLSSMGLKSCLDALDYWEKNQAIKEDNSLSLEAQIELLKQENDQLKAIVQQLLEGLKQDK
jgi:hypothetical protein